MAPHVTSITGKQEQGSCATVGGRVWRVWRQCPPPGHPLSTLCNLVHPSIYQSTMCLSTYLQVGVQDGGRPQEPRVPADGAGEAGGGQQREGGGLQQLQGGLQRRERGRVMGELQITMS